MIFLDGDVYEGNWKENLRDGYGTFKWFNGSVYEGGLQSRSKGWIRYF